MLEIKINEIGASGLLYTTRNLPFVDGGIYKLLEFQPIGYAIYHPEAYLFVEYSLATQSPYIEYSDNIFYGGPMSYLHFENDELLDVQSLETENIIAARNSGLGEYYQQLQYQDIRAKQYTAGERDSYAALRAPVNPTYVPNSHFFEFLMNFGTNSNKTCGYLAASMLLGYYDTFVSSVFADDNYIGRGFNYNQGSPWVNGVSPSISNQLHLDLIAIGASLGIGNLTWAESIKTVLNEYYVQKGVRGDCSNITDLITADFFMKNYIDRGLPFILFGNVENQKGGRLMHAVIAYGYEIVGIVTYYITHFGWENGYRDVRLANIWGVNDIGSTYAIEYSGSHIHNMNYYIMGRGVLCGCQL